MASPRDFYGAVYAAARELGATDVQARLAAAQASEETGYGQSMVGNNLFGIKASGSYDGPTVNAATNEEVNGVLSPQRANFRSYDDFTQSVKDYLSTVERNFPESWNAGSFSEAVKGLNNGIYGKYATNSRYGANLASIDSKYGGTAYAENPENVPTPFGPSDMQGGLLNAFSPTQQREDPFASLLGPSTNNWASMASASPVKSPLGSVTAGTELGAVPGLDASATATPSFDMSRFDGLAPSVATGFDPGRFAPPETASFDPSRFGMGAIDPATNTQSFMGSSPANLGSFPGAYAAQRGPSSGLLSADAMTVQGLAEKQLAETQQPSLSVPASGLLAANPGFSAQATVPSLANAYAAPQVETPAEQAINTNFAKSPGLLSPTSIAAANPSLSFTAPTGILAGQPVQQNQFVSSFPAAVANNTLEPPTVNDVVAAPTLENIQIAEQPTIAGPASTEIAPATTQQAEQTVKNEVAKTQQAQTKSPLSGMFNKGSILGGVLGGAVAGPIGGLLGALAGNQINKNGFSSLGGGFVSPTTQIGGGSTNIGGIYGGAFSPGTYAIANNGAVVTAQPGGWTSYTSPSGVNEMVSPGGQISHNFGSLFGGSSTPSSTGTLL